MTEQRYLADSTVGSFEAIIERTVSDDRVVLDRTHFYPEGGGQPADHGTIRTGDGREWAVVDVQKHDGIHHYLEPGAGIDDEGIDGEGIDGADIDGDNTERSGFELPEAGATVTAELDWERRESHMRYHTAQHLLSAFLLNEFDAETTGNQVRDYKATLDCAYERFNEDDLQHVEERLNELVDDARPVEWYVMDRETAEEELDPERTRLALLPDSITEIRIVEIGGRVAANGLAEGDEPASDDDEPFDRTACAGTHVSNTEEIGEVTVTGRETKGSDEERLTFEVE